MPVYRYDPTDTSRFAGTIGDLIARRGDIDANRAIQIANAQARAAEMRGQAWGGAVQNIAGSVGDALTGYMKQREEAPLRAQKLEAGRQDLELGRMQIASAKQAAEDKSILGSAQGSGLDPDSVKAQLRQLGRGDLIPIYEQTHASLETARLGLQAKRTEVQGLESDYFGALAAGVKKAKYDPMAIEWALAQADADGHDTKQIRGLLKQRPDALPQIIDSLIEKSPTQRKLTGEEADRALKTATENRTAADMAADNTRASAQAAEVARHNKEQERIAGITAGRSEAQATETARHNRAMEENARNAKQGRPVVSGDAGRIAEFDTSLDDLRVLRATVTPKEGESSPTGTRAKIGASVPNWVTEWTGFGATAKSKQGVIDRVKQVIGKALEGGVLRKEDEYKYEKILPIISDVSEVVETKLAGLEKAILQRRQTLLDALGDAGYDVSRFNARPPRDQSGGQITVTAPDGSTHPFATQAEADAFKKLAGIK